MCYPRSARTIKSGPSALPVLRLLAFTAVSARRKAIAVIVEIHAPTAVGAAIASLTGLFADVVHAVLLSLVTPNGLRITFPGWRPGLRTSIAPEPLRINPCVGADPPTAGYSAASASERRRQPFVRRWSRSSDAPVPPRLSSPLGSLWLGFWAITGSAISA